MAEHNLMTHRKRFILCTQPLFDDILAILSELSCILDAETVIKDVLDLFQAKTRHLRIEEVWALPLADGSTVEMGGYQTYR